MIDTETRTRRLAAVEREVDDATQRLREVGKALLEANQALAQIPLLEFRVKEVWDAREWFAEQNAALREENDRLRSENRRLAAAIRELEQATGSDAAA